MWVSHSSYFITPPTLFPVSPVFCSITQVPVSQRCLQQTSCTAPSGFNLVCLVRFNCLIVCTQDSLESSVSTEWSILMKWSQLNRIYLYVLCIMQYCNTCVHAAIWIYIQYWHLQCCKKQMEQVFFFPASILNVAAIDAQNTSNWILTLNRHIHQQPQLTN